jgi:DNA-3-methyladenine glycosylase II
MNTTPKSPAYWEDATAYLASQDTILAGLITAYPDATLSHNHNPFYTLTRAIVGQQISVKAADAVWLRLESRLDSLSPSAYLACSFAELRECGLSRQKIAYITHIAEAFLEKKLHPPDWEKMTDEEVIKQLTSIRGIGIWTAQMFLIFYLHRPDILPLADLGLLNAIQCHYAQERKLSKEEITSLAQVWKPYRTVATCYLWRSLDPVAVQY